MNTKKSTKVTIDQLLFAAAFLLALVIRFMRLAHTPLADLEADLALQALGLAEGSFAGNLSGQPGYILPTTIICRFRRWRRACADHPGTGRRGPSTDSSLIYKATWPSGSFDFGVWSGAGS